MSREPQAARSEPEANEVECERPQAARSEPEANEVECLVIAHRGASHERPENTFSAFALAIEQRADMIETDLHRTRDGAIVVCHDAQLASLPGSGEFADATLDQVRAVDVGLGEAIPTLDEVLDRFAAAVPFNLEIKTGSDGDYPGIEFEVLQALEARDLGATILFSSFSDAVLERLRCLSPGARIGVLVDPESPGHWRERCTAIGAEALHLDKRLADAATVAAAHALGLAVHVYTVDDPDEMRRHVGLGVDGLFTNRPARLRAILDPSP